MSNLKPKPTKIQLGDKEYGLLFTLNTLDDIQEHFNIGVEDLKDILDDPKKRFANIRWLITALINEAIDAESGEHLSERTVGRYITLANMNEFMSLAFKSLKEGSPIVEDPNLPSGPAE